MSKFSPFLQNYRIKGHTADQKEFEAWPRKGSRRKKKHTITAHYMLIQLLFITFYYCLLGKNKKQMELEVKHWQDLTENMHQGPRRRGG
jgi:hypothetical protein